MSTPRALRGYVNITCGGTSVAWDEVLDALHDVVALKLADMQTQAHRMARQDGKEWEQLKLWEMGEYLNAASRFKGVMLEYRR